MQEKMTPVQFKTTILNKINHRIDNLFKEIIGYMHSHLESSDPIFEDLEKKHLNIFPRKKDGFLKRLGKNLKKMAGSIMK